MTYCAIPEKANVVVLVAHPDDETLWAGGTLLMQRGWTTFVGTLCRAGDEDRAPKFFRALDMFGAKGTMADLDDGPAQIPLDEDKVRATIASMVPREHFDLILTHAPNGEYTRHLRHEEVSRCVSRMWEKGELQSRELWQFAYDDAGGHQLPLAEKDADILMDLTNEVWAKKHDLLTQIYGFVSDSWEVRTNPRREAFWRHWAPNDTKACLERGKIRS